MTHNSSGTVTFHPDQVTMSVACCLACQPCQLCQSNPSWHRSGLKDGSWACWKPPGPKVQKWRVLWVHFDKPTSPSSIPFLHLIAQYRQCQHGSYRSLPDSSYTTPPQPAVPVSSNHTINLALPTDGADLTRPRPTSNTRRGKALFTIAHSDHNRHSTLRHLQFPCL